MEFNLQDFLEKAKSVFDVAKDATVKGAKTASTKAGEILEQTKINAKIFGLKSECDVYYKKIGELVYNTSKDPTTPQNDLNEWLNELDAKTQRIAELQIEADKFKKSIRCGVCGNAMEADATFCSNCGAKQ